MTEVDWEERGPNTIGGRTRAVMFDPNNSTKIWAAGVNGGLWYNNDITSNTQDWNLVDGTWASLAVSSMAYDPNDTDVMYVGTGERFGNWVESGSNWYSPGASAGIGMFKSTDGGIPGLIFPLLQILLSLLIFLLETKMVKMQFI